MTAPALPDTLLKLALALVKHHIRNAMGDEALDVVASVLIDVGGEKVLAKLDSIFASKEGKRELLVGANAADQSFKKKCKDTLLRDLFTMGYGDLPSVQDAIAQLPKELDDEILRETLFKAFRYAAPEFVSDDQLKEGVDLYIECLQAALLPVRDYGIRIIYNALTEIGGDVKDIKENVKLLLEKAKTNSQDAINTRNPNDRFLVPFPHKPDFVGRSAELAKLHEMLQQGHTIVGIPPTVLVGMGGVGKTHLAVEYTHAHRDDYPSGVFWLNAINPLLLEFAELAEKLDMADRNTPRDKAAINTWDYLDSHHDSLVVLDNVAEPSELNIPFLLNLVPANLRCRLLLTTRQRNLPRTFQPLEVQVLPEVAAMRLLLHARPEVLEEHHPEWGWARIVCAWLGWLPLALELAAAYLGKCPEVSIMGYLERLRDEGTLETVDDSEVRVVDLPTRVEEVLKAAASGNLEQKHQIAVSATLKTQWNRLDDKDAQLLFRAAGQFPEASWIPIPHLSFLTGIENEAKPGRQSTLGVALKKLQAVSVIEELTDNRLRLHPLVREFATRLSPASFRSEMAERVATEFSDLLRLQARVMRYGVDIALEDVRTWLGFFTERQETKTYSQISKIERVLDRQACGLRDWNAQQQPVFFLQQILQLRNEAVVQDMKWQGHAEAELARLKKPYLFELVPAPFDSAELRTLVGHSGRVNSVALSANGHLAVSGSADKTLKVWDIPMGREIHTLSGHNDEVRTVALSADGHLAVSGSADKTLKVWDIPTGREIHTLSGHAASVNCVSLSADGHLAVSASADKTLKVWDIPTGREIHTLSGHAASVNCVSLSADGRRAVSASADKTLKIWDLETGHESHTLDAGNEKEHIALTLDGRLIISAEDTSLKVWDAETGQVLQSFGDVNDYADGVALSADGRLAACVIFTSLLVWEVQTARRPVAIFAHTDFIKGVALSADGRVAVTASVDKTIKVWDISSALSESEVLKKAGKAHNNRGRLGHAYGYVNGVALSADGKLAVSASSDNTLKVWEVATGRVLHTLTGHSKSVQSVAMSADGQLAVSSSDDMTVKVWEVATGRELRTFTGHSGSMSGVGMSADGRLAVSSSYVELDDTKMWTMNIWGVETGRKLRTLTGHGNTINGVALSANGRLAVSASSNLSSKVWDVKTGRELCTLAGPAGDVLCIAVSQDGQLAISAAWDQTIKVWDITSGRKLRTLTGHGDWVTRVALSADGQLAASTSDDMTLKVWSIASGHCIATLLVGVPLLSCAISEDKKKIVAGDNGGGVHFFELVGTDESKAQD